MFGPPDLLITDGGSEFAGAVQVVNELFGTVHEVVPEVLGCQEAERHEPIVKLMMMRTIKAMDLRGLSQMRLAALAAFSAKNRLCNKGGVSPLQAVTGRSSRLAFAADFRWPCAVQVQPGLGEQRGTRSGRADSSRSCGSVSLVGRARGTEKDPWKTSEKGPWSMCTTLQPAARDKLGAYRTTMPGRALG